MANHVKVNFSNEFRGELVTKNSTTQIGSIEGTILPYDMLLGSLAACLNATFLSIASKKRITFEEVSYDVLGIKREEVPTTLKEVTVTVDIKEASNESKATKSMELAAKYCSIYNTIAHVAEMKLIINHV